MLVNRILLALMQMLQMLQMLQTSRLWEGLRNNAENVVGLPPLGGTHVFCIFRTQSYRRFPWFLSSAYLIKNQQPRGVSIKRVVDRVSTTSNSS